MKNLNYVCENGIKEIKGLEKARAIRDKLSMYCIPLLEKLDDFNEDLGLSISNKTSKNCVAFIDEEYKYDEQETEQGYYIKIKGSENQEIIIPINNESKLESVNLGADELRLITNNEEFLIGYL